MQYTHLGRTGLSVSRLCLGTMNFGRSTDEPDRHEIMDRALDAGINFFDTANRYGWQTAPGLTEEIIGNWFATGRRPPREDGARHQGVRADGEWPNDGALRPQHPPRPRREPPAAEDRLRRPLPVPPRRPRHAVGGDLAGDGSAVQQGKVLYVGSCNFAGWHIAKAQAAARKRNFVGLVCEQSIYNLIERSVELEVLPAARLTASASFRGRRCTAACSAASSARKPRASAGSKAGRRCAQSSTPATGAI